MNKYVLTILVLCLLLIANNNRTKSVIINKYDDKLKINNIKQLKILTYNIQRLPHTFIENPNFIENSDADIICLQEYFHNIFRDKKGFLKRINYNVCIPEVNNKMKWDSGLVILSKYPIKYIDFIPFKKSSSIDSITEKGFLITKIKDLFIINAHLQACYQKSFNYPIIYSQLNQINEYIVYNNLNRYNCILCGDFNTDIQNIKWKTHNKFEIIKTINPTNWENNNWSTSHQLYSDQIGSWVDGGFIWSDKYAVKNIKNIYPDKNSDHSGVQFDLSLLENY